MSVRVEDTDGQRSGVTAGVVGRRLEPHPQVPSEGDKVHFSYRFDGTDDDSGPAPDACPRHRPDGALTGDDWLTVEHPEQVAGVLLIPNDQSHGSPTCDGTAGNGTVSGEPTVSQVPARRQPGRTQLDLNGH